MYILLFYVVVMVVTGFGAKVLESTPGYYLETRVTYENFKILCSLFLFMTVVNMYLKVI